MITKAVGGRIKELRLQLGLSQEKLALKAGIDRTFLAGVESGARNISLKSLDKIISALELTWGEFFRGTILD
ncbi:MAG: helix-turn-helix domain-containing protein [Defluviitaleaceae bacterium]|nr:helix-turn-helix domain-containing protein [Defluviitaleaceae bacterium]MCL2262678.1 helix-turn-helix domain-containing protein [Defluviitaleaceae bacterium]